MDIFTIAQYLWCNYFNVISVESSSIRSWSSSNEY